MSRVLSYLCLVPIGFSGLFIGAPSRLDFHESFRYATTQHLEMANPGPEFIISMLKANELAHKAVNNGFQFQSPHGPRADVMLRILKVRICVYWIKRENMVLYFLHPLHIIK